MGCKKKWRKASTQCDTMAFFLKMLDTLGQEMIAHKISLVRILLFMALTVIPSHPCFLLVFQEPPHP